MSLMERIKQMLGMGSHPKGDEDTRGSDQHGPDDASGEGMPDPGHDKHPEHHEGGASDDDRSDDDGSGGNNQENRRF